MEKILELKDVTFGYTSVPVLEDVNFEVERGDYMAIIGPNGAAKSTLMKIALGELTPWKGTVRLFGEDIRRFNDWGRVGYLSQYAAHINTAFPATVEEIVMTGMREWLRPIGGGKLHRRAENVLDMVGMGSVKHKLIGELSGGQRQRVFLARLLIGSPEIIFMDEPTTGVDAIAEAEFYELLDDTQKVYNLTIVMVSHDINAILKRATKVACVGNRKVHVHNTPDLTQEHLAEVFGYRIYDEE
ncbi:MAG: metal ABC transporter ATP-binding protein [Thermoanaerobacteraceae bacterium]|nr:metal ABC transporter ATP-binding protein [Thermoanaerobacteraceae bacterium]